MYVINVSTYSGADIFRGSPRVADDLFVEGVGSAQRYSYRWPADIVGHAVGEQNSVTVL